MHHAICHIDYSKSVAIPCIIHGIVCLIRLCRKILNARSPQRLLGYCLYFRNTNIKAAFPVGYLSCSTMVYFSDRPTCRYFSAPRRYCPSLWNRLPVRRKSRHAIILSSIGISITFLSFVRGRDAGRGAVVRQTQQQYGDDWIFRPHILGIKPLTPVVVVKKVQAPVRADSLPFCYDWSGRGSV